MAASSVRPAKLHENITRVTNYINQHVHGHLILLAQHMKRVAVGCTCTLSVLATFVGEESLGPPLARSYRAADAYDATALHPLIAVVFRPCNCWKHVYMWRCILFCCYKE